MTSTADNWALYALSKYIRQYLTDDEFPWLPQIDSGDSTAIQPVTIDGVSTFTATLNFSSDALISQKGYNSTRYQIATNITGFGSGLNKTRMADLTSTTWYTNTDNYSAKYEAARATFLADWQSALVGAQNDFKVFEKDTCFNSNLTTSSIFKQMNLNYTIELIHDFCNTNIRTDINQFMYPALYGPTQVLSYMLKLFEDQVNPVLFMLALDPASAVDYRYLHNFFDGASDNTDALVSSCERKFNAILSNVSCTAKSHSKQNSNS